MNKRKNNNRKYKVKGGEGEGEGEGFNPTKLRDYVRDYINGNKSILPSEIRDIPIGKWDTSSVTDMRFVFYGYFYFNEDISKWDVSSVTTMESMFENSEYINQSLNTWDVSKVTNMRKMFQNANSFNGKIEDWDVSSVTDMSYMFSYSKLFNQPIQAWNIKNVQNMTFMFYRAERFNQNLVAWDISKNVKTYNMFIGSGILKKYHLHPNGYDTNYYKIKEKIFNGKIPNEAFNIIDQEYIDIDKFIKTKTNKIFKFSENWFAVEGDLIIKHYLNMENRFYECIKTDDNSLIPHLSNLNIEVPLFQVNKLVSADAYVFFETLSVALTIPHQIFEISMENPIRHINSTSSHQMIMPNPNAVSANHCQSGKDAYIYEIFKLNIYKGGKKQKSRRRRCKKQKTIKKMKN
tara:strand:+ start:3303 stop:4517 length:1215 start_codon:yes stop_codon:yes gene_type:complete